MEEDLKGIEWTPLVDIVENEKEFLIKAELPELKKEEIRVSLEKGILRISGERHAEKEEGGKKFHRIERSYGSFSRSFTIPDIIDEKNVTADFKDGLLVLHLPKSEKAKEKKIEININ
ncbi:MAG: Hsp20/alpha crystallin family protein [Chthoniobacterales bacterium]